jgi:hypothetical protein
MSKKDNNSDGFFEINKDNPTNDGGMSLLMKTWGSIESDLRIENNKLKAEIECLKSRLQDYKDRDNNKEEKLRKLRERWGKKNKETDYK